MNRIVEIFRHVVQRYNPDKYWKWRNIVVDPSNRTPKIIKLFMLYYIKRTDAFCCSTFGTYIGEGAYFAEPPLLLHGLNGIIFGSKTRMGRGGIICPQVIVQQGGIEIGDNVFIGSGAKILYPCKIGNNVRIGANAIVFGDIPDNATVVAPKPRIIIRKDSDINTLGFRSHPK